MFANINSKFFLPVSRKLRSDFGSGRFWRIVADQVSDHGGSHVKEGFCTLRFTCSPNRPLSFILSRSRGGGREVDHSSKLRMDWAIPLLPLYAIMAYTEKILHTCSAQNSNSVQCSQLTARVIGWGGKLESTCTCWYRAVYEWLDIDYHVID